ncbi:hypothetical protein D3C81_1230960 [compost metagenome]
MLEYAALGRAHGVRYSFELHLTASKSGDQVSADLAAEILGCYSGGFGLRSGAADFIRNLSNPACREAFLHGIFNRGYPFLLPLRHQYHRLVEPEPHLLHRITRLTHPLHQITHGDFSGTARRKELLHHLLAVIRGNSPYSHRFGSGVRCRGTVCTGKARGIQQHLGHILKLLSGQTRIAVQNPHRFSHLGEALRNLSSHFLEGADKHIHIHSCCTRG